MEFADLLNNHNYILFSTYLGWIMSIIIIFCTLYCILLIFLIYHKKERNYRKLLYAVLIIVMIFVGASYANIHLFNFAYEIGTNTQYVGTDPVIQFMCDSTYAMQ